MFEKKWYTVTLLNKAYALADKIKHLFGTGKRKHRPDILTIYNCASEVLTVPLQIKVFKQFVKQVEITFLPVIERSNGKANAMGDIFNAIGRCRIFVQNFRAQTRASCV